MPLIPKNVLPVFLLLVSLPGVAKEVKLGNDIATYTLTCGKSIVINFTDLTEYNAGHTLLGLKNRETGSIDLFLSLKPVYNQRLYEQYNRVIYDNLSKTYIGLADTTSIVWGAARENDQNVDSYRIALGSHVYNCGKLERLPDETANRLYGDPDETDSGDEANRMYGQ